MPDHCNAFMPGELIQIVDQKRLVSGLSRYRNGADMLERLRPKCGQRFQITSYSFPHGGGVLYDLAGIDGPVWEECIIDWAINDGDETYAAAGQIYKMRIVEERGEHFLAIEDRNGRLFSKIWRADPNSALAEISQIAAIRCRGAFERRFGFEGDYMNQRVGRKRMP